MKNRPANPRKPSAASKGQSLAEYGLILALVGTVAIGGLKLMGASIQNQYNGLGGTLSQVATGGGSSLAIAASSSGTVSGGSNAMAPTTASGSTVTTTSSGCGATNSGCNNNTKTW
jgi:Flp pilus assembly pilin Flp